MIKPNQQMAMNLKTTRTDTDEAAEQSEDESEKAETDTGEAAEQSEGEPENAKTDTDN